MATHPEKDEHVHLPSSGMNLSRYPTEVQSSDEPPAEIKTKDHDKSCDEVSPDRAARRIQSALSITRTATATKPPSFTLRQEIGFTVIICMAQLLTQASLVQSIAPLHIIGSSFGTSNPGQLSWLPAAFSLTVGTFILPAGRWGDLYGHRRVFAFGYAWLAVWSLVAGFAVYSRSLIFFAVCRALQGIGSAMLIPNGLAILGRTYPPGPRKNMAFSLFGATAPGGFVLGALFSGIFAQFVWWPWAYWVSAIVLAVCTGLVFILVPAMPVAGGSPKLNELDIWGTLWGVSGLILFNFAWNQAPVVGWNVVYVYVLLILGCLFIGVFVWWELKVAEYPLLPTSAFTGETSLVLVCIALGWASFGIWVYYFWQLLEILRGETVLLATAQFTPAIIVGAIAAVATGRILGKIGPGWVMLIAMICFCIGNILLATVPIHQTYWAQTFVAVLITPFGMDMSFPAGSIILSNQMPRELQGVAASILCVVQNYWISIGLGMAGTVETQVSGGSLLRGYRGAWYLGIGLDVLGILCAVALVLVWRSTANAKQKVAEKARIEEA